MKKIIGILIFLLGASTVFVIGKAGIEKTERAECMKWQQEAKEHADYFLADWQKQQCDHYKIPIEIKKVEPQIGKSAKIEVEYDYGIASWYDYGIPGDPDYSKTHATAASRKYKRGTIIVVCSNYRNNDRCVEARVNDYGPSAKKHPERVVDLSSHAFKKLFPLSQGIGEVYITEIK